MFSKFKKVLVSLALAASLALAPMNVSATNPKQIDQDTSDGDKITPVFLTGTASKPQYTIEVSPDITINLDSNTTSAYDLNGSDEGHDEGHNGVYVRLTEASDFEGKNLQVTPSFAALTNSTSIDLIADDGKKDSKTLLELGVTDNLLKFGTYTNNVLNQNTNVATFAQGDASSTADAKPVTATVDTTLSDNIRRNMPNEIDGKGNVHIDEGQKIGNVTFTCQFVS